MNMLSDSESSDSDTGRRFKTAATRTRETFVPKNKSNNGSERDNWKRSPTENRNDDRYSRRSRSKEYRDRRQRERSRSKEQPTVRNRYLNKQSRSKERDRTYDDTRPRNRMHAERVNSRREEKSTSRRNSPSNDDKYLSSSRKIRDVDQSDSRERRRRSLSNEIKMHTKIARAIDSNTKDMQRSSSIEFKSNSRRQSRDSGRNESYKSSSREFLAISNNRKDPTLEMRTGDGVQEHVSIEKNMSTETGTKIKKSKHKKHKHKSKKDEKRIDAHRSSHSADRIIASLPKPLTSIRQNDINSTPINNIVQSGEESDEKVTICGPSLPPYMRKSQDSNEIEVDMVGPKLPTKSTAVGVNSQTIKGPTMPSDIDIILHTAQYQPPTKADSAVSDISDSDDDDLIGPMPAGIGKSEAHLELEKRALELKLAKLNKNESRLNTEPIREEWMTELPEVRSVAGLGLEARQFRTKERPEIGDRTGWTDTPTDRNRKAQKREPTVDELMEIKQRDSHAIFKAKRDAEQEAAARKHKKKHKRDESLLDIHQKKLKKKKEKDPEKAVRRPFSREDDLKVNRFDEAQKNSVIKKAQLLDTRFGSGQSKYL